MGRKVVLAVVCWLTLGEAFSEKKNVNNSVADNLSEESVPRLYHNVPVGVYASAVPYAAHSFHAPTFVSAPVTGSYGIKSLKDSYGQFVQTPQTAAYKSAFPQQFVQLQDLPAHLSQPLLATPGLQYKQSAPQAFFGSQSFSIPSLHHAATPTPLTSYGSVSQPLVYAGNIRNFAPSSGLHTYVHSYPTQQQSNAKPITGDAVTFQYLQQKPSASESHDVKPQPTDNHHHNGQIQAAPAQTSVTAIVNGKKTVVTLDTKPPLPLLDLNLLEPLKFDNPLVPQVQHFLPRINAGTYHKLPKFNVNDGKKNVQKVHKTVHTTHSYDSDIIVGKPKKQAPKKQNKPRVQITSVGPTITVKTTPKGSPELSYEINKPGYKETYNEQVLSYNKETSAKPVTYTYNMKSHKEPVTYSFTRNSEEPIQIKHVEYDSENDKPKELVYRLNPQEQQEEQNEDSYRPTAQQESEDSRESSNESEDDTPSEPQHHSHGHHSDSRQHQPHYSGHNNHINESPAHRDSNHKAPTYSSHQSGPKQFHHYDSPKQHHESHETHHDAPRQHHAPHGKHHETPQHTSHQPHHHHKEKPSSHSHHHGDHSSHHGDYQGHHDSPPRHSPHHDEHNTYYEAPQQSHHLQAEHRGQYQQRPRQAHHEVVHSSPQYSHPVQTVEQNHQFQPVINAYEENIRLSPEHFASLKVDPTQHIQLGPSTPHAIAPQSSPQQAAPHRQEQPTRETYHDHPAPHILEKSKEIIIKKQEETPDEVHLHDERLMGQMVQQEKNSEEDFEKGYKESAFGFPAYEETADTEKDIYSPESYGEPKYHTDYDIERTPFEQYQEEGDQFPKSSRSEYKDASDKMRENYFLEFAVSKPQSLLDRFKMKENYYKTYTKQQPEKQFSHRQEDQKKKERYVVAPSYIFPASTTKPKQNHYLASYKEAPKRFEFDYSKGDSRDNSAFASRPFHRYKTHFVEPQFQYGFEPMTVPLVLDSELAAMASNNSPETEKPGIRKKVFKENWYIKKTSTTAGKPS